MIALPCRSPVERSQRHVRRNRDGSAAGSTDCCAACASWGAGSASWRVTASHWVFRVFSRRVASRSRSWRISSRRFLSWLMHSSASATLCERLRASGCVSCGASWVFGGVTGKARASSAPSTCQTSLWSLVPVMALALDGAQDSWTGTVPVMAAAWARVSMVARVLRVFDGLRAWCGPTWLSNHC